MGFGLDRGVCHERDTPDLACRHPVFFRGARIANEKAFWEPFFLPAGRPAGHASLILATFWAFLRIKTGCHAHPAFDVTIVRYWTLFGPFYKRKPVFHAHRHARSFYANKSSSQICVYYSYMTF